MTFYTSDGCSYTGMDLKTIQNLRAELGLDTEMVAKETYDVKIESDRATRIIDIPLAKSLEDRISDLEAKIEGMK